MVIAACVPGRCRFSRDERFPTGEMKTTVAERSAWNREELGERAGGKLSTVGTRTGSEAGCGGRAGKHARSPMVIRLHSVKPDGTRGKNRH